MPYPNYHAARVRDPADFIEDSFRTKEITTGILLITGKLKADGADGAMKEQGYRFDKDKFTVEQAKAWLRKNDISYIDFEPAKGEKSANGLLYRTIGFEVEKRAETGEMVTAIISTEYPCERPWGLEILDHQPGSCDLSRCSRGLPLLFSHDRDQIIGRAENIRFDARRLRADLRPARNSRAVEIWQDIKGGILRDVSIGYQVDESSKQHEGNGSFRFMKWQLLETSVVSVPGDPLSGIGRNLDIKGANSKMDKCAKCGAELTPEGECKICSMREVDREKLRVANILEMAKHENCFDEGARFIQEGKPDSEFAAFIIKRAKDKLKAGPGVQLSGGDSVTSHRSAEGAGPCYGGASYRKLFGEPAPMREYKDLRHFISCVQTRQMPEALQRVMSGGVGTAGGFAVPEQLANFWLDGSVEDEVIFPRATVYPMASDTLKIPAWNIGSHASSLFGGIEAAWTAEGVPASDQAPKLRQLQLQATKCFLFVRCTSELLGDSPNFETNLKLAFQKSISFFRDDAFLTGNGIGQPQGILTSPCTLTVTRNTASDVKIQDLAGMCGKMAPWLFNKSIWVLHPSVLVKLLQLSITIGTTGGQYLPIQDNQGNLSIFSRPCVISEKGAVLGSKGDVMLIAPSEYIIGMRSDMRLESSRDEYFRSDQVSFRLIIRCDGQSAWDQALTLKDSVSQVSPFIVLE